MLRRPPSSTRTGPFFPPTPLSRSVTAADHRDAQEAPTGPAETSPMTKGPVRLDVSVGYALPRAGLPAAVSFRKWVAAALAGRIREADLAVRLVDAREGRAPNRHYRGRDYATNVLSFPADVAEGIKLPNGRSEEHTSELKSLM